jgi:hypothetical protein
MLDTNFLIIPELLIYIIGSGSNYNNRVIDKIIRKIKRILRRIIILLIRLLGLTIKTNKKIVNFAHPASGNDILRIVIHSITGGRPLELIEREKDEFGNRQEMTLDFLIRNDKRTENDDIINYHLSNSEKTKELCQYFIDNNYILFLTMRDPRDVLLSKYNRIIRDKHFHYNKLFQSLNNRAEGFEILLKDGFMNKKYTDPLSVVYEDYLRWTKNKKVMTIQYEHIVGKNGFNSVDKPNKLKRKEALYSQNKLIDMIYNHLGYDSNALKRFFIRSIIYLTVTKGRVNGHKYMTRQENEIFYKYFSKNLLFKLYPENQ